MGNGSMKSKFTLLATIVGLFASSLALAEIAEVYSWKANPGKAPEMLQSMAQAKAIHEKFGIKVHAYATTMGTDGFVDYVMRYDSIEDWGAARDAMNTSAEWTEYWNAAQENAAGTQISSITGINMDASVKADSFAGEQVYNVFVWEASPGRQQELMERFVEAAKLHESLGARVEIYVGGVGSPNQLHYVMNFGSWSEMAASQAKMMKSRAWAKLMAERDYSLATLVSSHSGQKLPF
jgi:hypothetical protein